MPYDHYGAESDTPLAHFNDEFDREEQEVFRWRHRGGVLKGDPTNLKGRTSGFYRPADVGDEKTEVDDVQEATKT